MVCEFLSMQGDRGDAVLGGYVIEKYFNSKMRWSISVTKLSGCMYSEGYKRSVGYSFTVNNIT